MVCLQCLLFQVIFKCSQRLVWFPNPLAMELDGDPVNARLGFFVPFVMQSSFDLLLFPIVYFFGCQPLFANSLCFILALDELRDKINEKMTDHFLS